MLLGACGSPESEAVRYTRALTESADHAEAKALCLGLESAALQGDCLVSAMEQWGVVDAAECSAVSAPVWYDECLFLLAERQRTGVDLDTAIATCASTRFARKCAWHLVQDEAQASLDETPAVAEARIAAFDRSRAVPDAGEQFWYIRFQELAAAERPVAETDCEGLQHTDACQRGLRRYLRSVLDALGKRNLEQVCARELGQRATRGGEPAWVDGPVARDEESHWAEQRCTRMGGHQGAGPAPATLPLPGPGQVEGPR